MSLYDEIKRHHIVRVSLAYFVVAWMVLQVADVLFEALLLPDWANRLVAALLILGYPVALLLAWAHNLPPDGPGQKESPKSSPLTGKLRHEYVVIGAAALGLTFIALVAYEPGSRPEPIPVSQNLGRSVDDSQDAGPTTEPRIDDSPPELIDPGQGTDFTEPDVPGFAVGHEFQDSLRNGQLGPRMVVLPLGSFEMGSESGDEDEQPKHIVTISRPFAMMKHELTFAEYDQFVAATGATAPDDQGWGRASRPVIYVSWGDARAYAAWLSQQTGESYRMPSESEWEFAARAGSATRYEHGDSVGTNQANCFLCGSRWDGEQTAPVGSFGANRWGLHDMHGNVWEWVEDCYDDNYIHKPVDGLAKQDCRTKYRAMRGGSWFSVSEYLRSSNRHRDASGYNTYALGFRLVRDLSSP